MIKTLSPLLFGGLTTAACLLLVSCPVSGASVITAGNLAANLQNSDLNPASPVWVNQATGSFSLGNFTTIGGGNTNVQNVGGFNGLLVNTTTNNAMQSASTVPLSLTGNGSMTVEAWVYTTNLFSGFSASNVVASYGTGGNAHPLRQLGYGPGGQSGSNAFATDNFNDLGYPSDPPTGAYTLVDYVYQSSNNLASVYLNGNLAVSGTFQTLATTQTNLFLGVAPGGNNPFAGYIAAFRVQDGVLSASDIMNNYNAGVAATVAAVPEPSTYVLLLSGMGVVFFLRRRAGKSAALEC